MLPFCLSGCIIPFVAFLSFYQPFYMPTHKIRNTIAVAVSLIALGIIAWFAYAKLRTQNAGDQTTKPAASQSAPALSESYASNAMGIEVKYPAGWQVLTTEEPNAFWLIFSIEYPNKGQIRFEQTPNEKNITLDAFATQLKTQGVGEVLLPFYAPDIKLSLAGNPAIQLKLIKPETPPLEIHDVGWEPGLVKDTIVQRENQFMRIMGVYGGYDELDIEGQQQFEVLYDQILASVRFN